MARFYTVQQTATILGYSTNSIYKFLDQNRLKSTRGNSKQGRFRIPHTSIEEFLGTKVSEIAIARALTNANRAKKPEPSASTPTSTFAPPTSVPTTPKKVVAKPVPTISTSTEAIPAPRYKTPLGLALTRLLILIAIILTILETALTQTITPLSQLFRLLILTISILLAYQSGGSKPEST